MGFLLRRCWLLDGKFWLDSRWLKNSLTSALKSLMGLEATKLYTCMAPFMPTHSSQSRPATLTLPWDEPIG